MCNVYRQRYRQDSGSSGELKQYSIPQKSCNSYPLVLSLRSHYKDPAYLQCNSKPSFPFPFLRRLSKSQFWSRKKNHAYQWKRNGIFKNFPIPSLRKCKFWFDFICFWLDTVKTISNGAWLRNVIVSLC